MSEAEAPKKKRVPKKNGAPYKLDYQDHVDLIRRRRAGQPASELAALFRIGLMTVYEYLKLDPEKRKDRPSGAA